MVTGRKAFEGKSQASVIAAILDREPAAMSSLQPSTPPLLERTLRLCLAKSPDNRWQNASDLMRELEWISDTAAHPTIATRNDAPARRRERLAWGLVALSTLASLGVRNPPFQGEIPSACVADSASRVTATRHDLSRK